MNVHGSRIHVFSLTANRLLSKQIAENLKLPVGKAVVSTFSDGDVYKRQPWCCAVAERKTFSPEAKSHTKAPPLREAQLFPWDCRSIAAFPLKGCVV